MHCIDKFEISIIVNLRSITKKYNNMSKLLLIAYITFASCTISKTPESISTGYIVDIHYVPLSNSIRVKTVYSLNGNLTPITFITYNTNENAAIIAKMKSMMIEQKYVSITYREGYNYPEMINVSEIIK